MQVPSKNTYEVIDRIQTGISAVYQENGLDRKDTAVLLSAGPAAKVLVKRMSSQGFRMIDCGHAWDDPLEV